MGRHTGPTTKHGRTQLFVPHLPPQRHARSAPHQHPPDLRQHLPRKGLAAVPQLVLVQLLQHLCLRQRHWHKVRAVAAAAAASRLWRPQAGLRVRLALPRGPVPTSRSSPVDGLPPGAVNCQPLVLCCNGCQHLSLEPLHYIKPRHPAKGAHQEGGSRRVIDCSALLWRPLLPLCSWQEVAPLQGQEVPAPHSVLPANMAALTAPTHPPEEVKLQLSKVVVASCRPLADAADHRLRVGRQVAGASVMD